MFWSYLKIALRNLRKHKKFAAINILGLAVGLTTFLFAKIFVDYEAGHDSFFEGSEHIYTIGTVANDDLLIPYKQINATYTAAGPVIEAELGELEAVARVIVEQQVVAFNQDLRAIQAVSFADPGFTEIFNFNYLYGSADAMEEPKSVIITESVARTYFGTTDATGKVITVDNRLDLTIGAIIEDIPTNSHFYLNQAFPLLPQQIFVPMAARENIRNVRISGGWQNLRWKDLTYVRLPEHLDQQWLETQLGGVYERHVPERTRWFMAGFSVRPIHVASMATWDRLGIPVLSILPILGALVLFVACINYTNLAVAQSLSRSREIGMRKTMGASRRALLYQFISESVLVASLSMLISVAAIEIILPLFNNATGKTLRLDYLNTILWVLGCAIVVGVIAGFYPAWLITRLSVTDALSEKARKGKWGANTRSLLIGAQFAISIFLLASVAIVYAQNKKMENESDMFPHSEILHIAGLRVEGQYINRDRFRLELKKSPLVKNVTFSSQTPFSDVRWQANVLSEQGDLESEVEFYRMLVDSEFMATYDIELLAGRNLDRKFSQDVYVEDVSEISNILINETAARALGFESPEHAINTKLFRHPESTSVLREFVIVGVVSDRNILGLNNAVTPWIFHLLNTQPTGGVVRFQAASIKFHPDSMDEAFQILSDAWDVVSPNQPVFAESLTTAFDRGYTIFRVMNSVLAALAFVAVMLALVGLFGLTAIISLQRTREIGIRKVLGASSAQILKLLVLQISKPVIWAICVAVPALLVGIKIYFGYFPDHITYWGWIVVVAICLTVLLGWVVIAAQTYRASTGNPVHALRQD